MFQQPIHINLTEKSLVDRISDWIKIGVPISTAVGFFIYTIFYSNFKIFIINYIQITEVINLFLVFFFFALGVFLIVSMLYEHFHKFLNFVDYETLEKYENNSIYIVTFIVLWKVLVIIFIIDFLVVFISYATDNFVGQKSIPYFFAFPLVVYLLYTAIVSAHMDQDKEAIRNSHIFFYMITSIMFLMMFTNVLANQIKFKVLNYRTSIELTDKTISCNDTLLYIGKTSNYFFLYDLPKGEPIIYRMDNVKSIHLRNAHRKSIK